MGIADEPGSERGRPGPPVTGTAARGSSSPSARSSSIASTSVPVSTCWTSERAPEERRYPGCAPRGERRRSGHRARGFEHARRRAADAGVDVEWVEGDAQDMPFPDETFDRVISTFGAMFAPDHERAAAELVRVCRPGGRVAMTTWVTDGYAGEIFKLTGAFLPPPPPGVQPPPLWGVESHVEEVFAAAGVTPDVVHEHVELTFGSEAGCGRRVHEHLRSLRHRAHRARASGALAGVRPGVRGHRSTVQSRHRRQRTDSGRVSADHRRPLTSSWPVDGVSSGAVTRGGVGRRGRARPPSTTFPRIPGRRVRARHRQTYHGSRLRNLDGRSLTSTRKFGSAFASTE